MRVFFFLLVLASTFFLSACGDWGVDNKTESLETPENRTQTYYDTEGRMGSSWMVNAVAPCDFEMLMDENGILFMKYSKGCQVEHTSGAIRLSPEKEGR